jgi:hypothetical protein
MKTYQWPIHAMFGDLVVGMHEIVEVHDLKDEAVWDITVLVEDLFEKHVWRRPRTAQRSMRATYRELVVGMSDIVNAHDLGDEVVGHIAEVLGGLLETNRVLCRTMQASIHELFDDLFAIYEGAYDEEPASGRELLDELLAVHLERCRKKQKPRRRGPHPAMVELLARLDRYGSDHEESQSKAAPAAD